MLSLEKNLSTTRGTVSSFCALGGTNWLIEAPGLSWSNMWRKNCGTPLVLWRERMSSRCHEFSEIFSNKRLTEGIAHATEIRPRVVIREASKGKCMLVVGIEEEPKFVLSGEPNQQLGGLNPQLAF